MSATPSFTVTPNRLGFALSIVAVLTFGWNVADYVKAQEYRITSLEAYQAENKALTKDMLTELRRLSEAVTKLSTIIDGARSLDGKQASNSQIRDGFAFERPSNDARLIDQHTPGVVENVADAAKTGGISTAQDLP